MDNTFKLFELFFVRRAFLVAGLLFRNLADDQCDQRSDEIEQGKGEKRSEKVLSLSDKNEGDQYVKKVYDVMNKMRSCKGHFIVVEYFL